MIEVHVYTDGSHLDKQHGGRLGCGGVVVINGKAVNTFSRELDAPYMQMMFGSSKCSNPSAEFVAIYLALTTFKKELKGADQIVFYSDFVGIKDWMSGRWKAKETIIKNIKSVIDAELKKQGLTDKVDFQWVKGHQKSLNSHAYWNNYADKLAKGEKK